MGEKRAAAGDTRDAGDSGEEPGTLRPEDSAAASGRADDGRMTVDSMLAEARAELDRLTPAQLAAILEAEAGPEPGGPTLVIDIRDRDDRERTGMVAGSLSIPLMVLQWRCDPSSGHGNPAVESLDQPLVVVCNQGYASSLAAASLRRLGFSRATDLEGGVEAWVAAGFATTPVAPRPAVGTG